MGSSMAADTAQRQRQAAADAELLQQLEAENLGTSQEEIAAMIEKEKEKEAIQGNEEDQKEAYKERLLVLPDIRASASLS